MKLKKYGVTFPEYNFGRVLSFEIMSMFYILKPKQINKHENTK